MQQRILETAAKLFGERGVEHVSMNQIVTEAGIGPGTLYRRYRNKGDLCLALIYENVILIFEEIEKYLEENQTKPANERLSLLEEVYAEKKDYPGHVFRADMMIEGLRSNLIYIKGRFGVTHLKESLKNSASLLSGSMFNLRKVCTIKRRFRGITVFISWSRLWNELGFQ